MISEELKKILETEAKFRSELQGGVVDHTRQDELFRLIKSFTDQSKLESDVIRDIIMVAIRFGRVIGASDVLAHSRRGG